MARGIRSETREGEGRQTRVPLGVARLKLAVPEIPGYKSRWMNDDAGRIQMALQGGYEFVTPEEAPTFGDPDIDNVNRDLGARVSRVGDKSTGKRMYLMKIKKEFYEEDQKAKTAKVEEADRLIKRGKLDDDVERYVPDKGKGISIDTR
jgi:hypothetical protein